MVERRIGSNTKARGAWKNLQIGDVDINVNNLTLAEIVRTISTLTDKTTATNFFKNEAGEDIPNLHVLRSIRQLFAIGRIPWANSLTSEICTMTLEVIGCRKVPILPDSGNILPYASKDMERIKTRISGVKTSMTKAMLAINAATNANAQAVVAQQALNVANQAEYDRGYAAAMAHVAQNQNPATLDDVEAFVDGATREQLCHLYMYAFGAGKFIFKFSLRLKKFHRDFFRKINK